MHEAECKPDERGINASKFADSKVINVAFD